MSNIISVFAAKCDNYEEKNVDKALDDILSQMGGISALVPPNAKVFVKVNLVREMSPNKCGTTHPEVAVALCKQRPMSPLGTVVPVCTTKARFPPFIRGAA